MSGSDRPPSFVVMSLMNWIRAGRGPGAILLLCFCAAPLHAAAIGRDADLLRTGWYPDEPALSPLVVSSGAFGQRFSTPLVGAVYAQPLVLGDVLFVATQANWIYGLDPDDGTIRWSRNVGTPVNASDLDCDDIAPTIGITSTPVIDSGTGIAYFTSKTYAADGATAIWLMHAVSVATGAEQRGFPVTIQGVAQNDPAQTFNAATENQRPGLLVMNHVVYAAFGGACDLEPFQGWIFGVSTNGAITARWVDRAAGGSGNGIWMSGAALLSDAPGEILFATGNGISGGTPGTPLRGSSPPEDLGESIVRLHVRSDGSLAAVDFFTPAIAPSLEPVDGDLGSGGVIGLPDPPFGTPDAPHLLLQVGKSGVVTLFDARSLGGYLQGPGGGDLVVQEVDPRRGGVWSKPAVWGGDGGWVYVPTTTAIGDLDETSGFLDAYQFQSGLLHSGRPALRLAGSSSDAFGFSSSAPVVTSRGTASGSALVWIVWNPDASGEGAELRAYDAIPVDGVLPLRFSAPVGVGSKFNPPGVSANRIFVGTRDGRVIGFGLTPGLALSDLGLVHLGTPHPNPAARGTSVEFALGRGGPASLAVFDLSGRRVRRLLEGDVDAGPRRIAWDGRDEAGARVPAGLYLVRLEAGGTRRTERVFVLR